MKNWLMVIKKFNRQMMSKLVFHSTEFYTHHTMISVCPKFQCCGMYVIDHTWCGPWAADLAHPKILAWRPYGFISNFPERPTWKK